MVNKLLRWGMSLLLVLLLVAAGGWLWLHQSLPQTEGRIALPDLSAPVSVARDAHGIPTIKAASEADAYFALGFVHAQDRLWQMESQRRAGAGRMAEIAGPAALNLDRFMRTLGVYRLAEQNLAHLSPETRAVVDAYTAGVNAYLATDPVLPPEFQLLRYRPEPWKAADSIVWGRLMALQLSGNWREEIQRQRLTARLSPQQMADLFAPSLPEPPVTIGAVGATFERLLAELPPEVRPRLASNVWVVDGDHAASGKPLLANDPHLGFQVPILWYLARLEAPGLSLTGATVPGVPFHLLGHNGRIAWGITTTHSDTMDLFVETAVSADHYLTPQGPAPYLIRREIIAVKGEPAIELDVRETRHGPVINGVLAQPPADEAPIALAAAAFQADDLTAQAIHKLNRAQDWNGFVAAMRDFHSPQQNIAFADVSGQIGLISPGRVPIRRKGDGSLPVPGASGEYDWTGWVPWEGLPQVSAPASGRIVNANNQVVPDDHPYLLTAHWPDGHRARRIGELLDARRKLDVEGAEAMLLDAYSPITANFLPMLLNAPAKSERAAKAQTMLRNWDGVMHRDEPEPMIFSAWMIELQQRLLAPKLGELAPSLGWLRPGFLSVALSDKGDWCSPNCPQIAAEALDTATARLAERFGDGMAEWRWGDLHRAHFEHQLFRNLPILRDLTGRDIDSDGDDFTVNRGSFDPQSYQHEHGAGLRAVHDLADLSRSRFVIATGQSGNPLSPHYDDLMPLWRDGVMLDFTAPAKQTLTLEPR